MTIEIITAIVVFGVLLFYLGSPLMKSGGLLSDKGLHLREDLAIKKAQSLALIHEIDLDYSLKKMSEEDYKQTRSNAMAEGVEVLKKIDRLDSGDTWQVSLEDDLKKLQDKAAQKI